MFGYKMNEEFFASMQKPCCWFNFPLYETLPQVDVNDDITEPSLWCDDTLVQRHIFAMIFGCYGYSVDLERAEKLTTKKLFEVAENEPPNSSLSNPETLNWLNTCAKYSILLGTIYAYIQDYGYAAIFFLMALKLRALNLFMPYCDFIKYVLSKLDYENAETIECDGVGFSADNPMGSVEYNGGRLMASVAEDVISSLEGENGEVVLAFYGRQSYGGVNRLGSTGSKNFRNRIDVYEVYILDKYAKLKKIKFYFNGYFNPESQLTIKLPKGFRFTHLNLATTRYKVVN